MKRFLNQVAAGMFAICFPPMGMTQQYTQVNLVSNVSGGAPVTDSQLVNGWGISRGPGTPWWVSDAGTGVSTLYNGVGAKQSLVVTIPKNDPNDQTFPTGTPTGTIFNGRATDFLLAPGRQATFLFSTLDGTIAGWNAAVGVAQGANPPSTNAITVARGAKGSTYTGLTAAFIDDQRYLYAANFTKGRVDVFDNTFKPVSLDDKGRDRKRNSPFFSDDDFLGGNDTPFTDERLPRNYVPFNVQTVGNDIVVTYALHLPNNPVETPGPGLGYVNIYSSEGKLLRRLEHGDWLNAPWGVALAPLDFGRYSHALLIANFAGGGTTESAGYISAYDVATGKFEGLLEDASGKPISINGIWGIGFANSVSASSYDPAGAPASELYFSAGPNQETGGLFGYLKPVPTELIQGNSQ